MIVHCKVVIVMDKNISKCVMIDGNLAKHCHKIIFSQQECGGPMAMAPPTSTTIYF